MAAIGEGGGGGEPGIPGGDPAGIPGGDPGGDPIGDPGGIPGEGEPGEEDPTGPDVPTEGGAVNLPDNFDSLPNELKFQILDQLDAAGLIALRDTSMPNKDLVLSYVKHLVASDGLVYAMGRASIKGEVFPGEDEFGPVDFDNDAAGTLALWNGGWLDRAP